LPETGRTARAAWRGRALKRGWMESGAGAESGAGEADADGVDGAGDTGIVIANEFLAGVDDLGVGAVEEGGNEEAEVVFDTAAVLAGGGNDAGALNEALLVEAVAVIEESAGSLGDGAPLAGMDVEGDGRRVGLAVGVEDLEAFLKGEDELDGAGNDAGIGIGGGPGDAAGGGGLTGGGGEVVEVEVDAGERADEVAGSALGTDGVESGGVGDVLLEEELLEVADGDVEAA